MNRQIGVHGLRRSRFSVGSTIGEYVELIAKGSGVLERKRLGRAYDAGVWRKLKGIARIKLRDGTIQKAELHWYEAHGIGKKEFKIKRLLG
jgi:hypothetical protein